MADVIALRHSTTTGWSRAALYADGSMPEYWIVNLVDDVLEVYRDPVEGA